MGYINSEIQYLKALAIKLKSGEYDGYDIMRAWIAVERLADILEKQDD